MLTVLIMAGGSGERFWPLSTPEHPKQVLSIFSGKPMIRETIDRVLPLVPIERIFVATNKVQEKSILEALPDLPKENLIIEPAFKDTAAAIGFGSLNIKKKFPNVILAVLAADHLIKDQVAFLNNLKEAERLASKSNAIVTLGITPNKPETGYGYIEVLNPVLNQATRVLSFKEKPNYETALAYVESNNYLWNSGMFVFSLQTIFDAFKTYAPSHFKVLNEIETNLNSSGETLKSIFESFEKISIDFAIMEKYDNILLIPTDFGWSDVGDFNALETFYDKDKFGNIDLTETSIFVDSSNNIVVSENYLVDQVALLDISDHVIVLTQSKLLITTKSSTQRIKEVLKKVKR